MALGTNHLTGGLGSSVAAAATVGSVDAFVPELWSDDVIAAYKQNLVMANLVTRLNHVGKKGDAIHIPSPARGSANAKAASTQVTLNQIAATNIDVLIDKHFEYSVIIEDILDMQALPSMRRFTTDDAGYALSKQVDGDLIQLGRGVQGGSGTNAYTAGIFSPTGTTVGTYVSGTSTAVEINDYIIRHAEQLLDDADVPLMNRALVIPPSAKKSLLGINRFTEQAFIGSGDAIKTGMIGNLYGTEVYVTTNADTTNDVAGDRVCLLVQKDAFVLAEQMNIRSQAQYKQEWLGTLVYL